MPSQGIKEQDFQIMKNLHVTKLLMYTITSITNFLGYAFEDTHMLWQRPSSPCDAKDFFMLNYNKNIHKVKKKQGEYPKFGHK
jgi:hypothetical protein